MRYYITADIHGFYTEFHKALDEAGYFNDPEPHKLIILGDLFDRGQEAVEMQHFILSILEQDAAILVRGKYEIPIRKDGRKAVFFCRRTLSFFRCHKERAVRQGGFFFFRRNLTGFFYVRQKPLETLSLPRYTPPCIDKPYRFDYFIM